MPSRYVGRFAPSPTGPLHFGSLVAALGSWVDAHHHHGRWLLRMEDIDPPREIDGASDAIIQSLARHGLRWHGEISWQSRHGQRYEQALTQLSQGHHLYACRCTRKQLRARQAAACIAIGPRCPQRCDLSDWPAAGNTLRVRVPAGVFTASDLLHGPISADVEADPGDFLVRRRDGLYAYQLAVVVDDCHQSITHVVRGTDLLDSTPRQVALQKLLGYPTPDYLHLPLVLDPHGQKLSKQTGAAALDDNRPMDNLRRAWAFLGQQSIAESITSTDAFLHRATELWARTRLLDTIGG